MSLFGKIKSAVMGNPVTREYEIGKHVCSAGPGLLWKIHNGVKKTTRQEVSVFIYDKKSPEVDKIPKKHREAVLVMLRKGPTHLIRLKHPRLLTIEHQLEESSDTLAFVTEPIVASLANVLGRYDNLPTPLPLAIKEHQLHTVEIQYGLLQLSESLDFLHNDAKMLHGNITAEVVVINSKGGWKLMGFNFCSFSQYQSEAQVSFAFREWDTRGSTHTNPTLDYLAPEYILSKSCSQASDVFSFGMLCFAVYNEGTPLYDSHNNVLTFKHNAEQVSRVTEGALRKVPAGFKPLVRSMLAIEPAVRPDALQITKHAFFEEVSVSTLKYLDMLFQRSDMEKSQFFKKNLARVISTLPKRVVHQRVLPALSGEFRNHKMIPFVLPLILLVAEDCSIQDYGTLIMPVLIPAFGIQDPVQVPLIFLQKMDLLLKKTSQDNIKRYILPMIITSLEAENGQLQELCISILPTFANMVDYSSMKHSIVPRLTALCLMTRESSLVIKCLVCLGQMLDILDKHIVLDHILPVLEQVTLKEPGVLMAILGIYHQTLKNKKLGIDKMMLATRVIPFLIPLSIEPMLNVAQFNQFMMVVREMLSKVESEHQTYLEQLSEMEEQTKSTVDFAREVSENKAMDDAINRIEDIFTGSETRGSHDPAVAARKGTSPPKTVSNTTTTETIGADLLAGLSVSDMAASTSNKPSPSLSSKTTTSKASNTTSSSQPSRGKVINFGNQSTSLGIGTWESLGTSSSRPLQPLQPTSSGVPLQPLKTDNTGYTPPLSHKTGLTGNTGFTPPLSQRGASTGMTGNTGYMTPPLQLQAPPANNTSSLFAGMQTGNTHTQQSQGGMLQPTKNDSLFSGMQGTSYNQAQGNNPQGTGNLFTGMQMNSNAPGMTQRSGMNQQQPLVRTPAQSGGSAGWSSSIGGNGTQNANYGNPNSGWSSNVAPSANTGTGWSQNMGGMGGTGMEHQQYGSGSGMGQQQYGTGMGQQQYGVAGSQSSPSVMVIPNNQQPVNKPASGANPFADLSFLS